MGATPSPLAVIPPGSLPTCPHGGQTPSIRAEPKVHASGNVLATVTPPPPVAITPSCGFTTGGNPHPCSLLSGVKASTRIFVNGKPALLVAGLLLCKAADQAPQGTPLFLQAAARVAGK